MGLARAKEARKKAEEHNKWTTIPCTDTRSQDSVRAPKGRSRERGRVKVEGMEGVCKRQSKPEMKEKG